MDYNKLKDICKTCKTGFDIIKAYRSITHSANENIIDFYQHDELFDILKGYEIVLDYDT